MPIPPSFYTNLNQYLRDELGTDADKFRLDPQMGLDVNGHPLGSFESMHGIRATLSHDPAGSDPNAAPSIANRPLYEFTLRHDNDSGSFFMNGSRIMAGPGASTQDALRLIASKMAAGYRQSVKLDLDKFTAKDIFNAQMQAYKGSYVDPNSAMTPGMRAKINSETYFGQTFNPTNYGEDSGPFSINGQHYFSRTQKMHGPSVEGMYPSLEGSMWSYAPDGSLMFANPKATTHVDPVTQQLIIDNDNATKFIKHAQKRGTGDIGRLIDPMTGREISGSESAGYRTDPFTGRLIRDQGYDLNYFIPVGGGELNMGQVAQYRPLDFQIDRTMTITGPEGYWGDGLAMTLPASVVGQRRDIPGLGRTTGQWDRVDIARDRTQIYSSHDFGDTAYIPVTMTIAAAGNTAQGHSGIKGYNVMANPGAYGAPAGMDFGIAANAIKDPIAWANANITGNMDYLMAQGKSMRDAANMLGFGSNYNTDIAKGPLGYNQSDMANYGAIRQAYQTIVGASWNQAQGGIIARVNTNIGKFGAWQWGGPGLPSEDMPKLASMDPAYYNRVNAYSAERQDPYAEIFNSGVAMGNSRAGFTPRSGVAFDDTLSAVLTGALSQYNGSASTSQFTDALGHALEALDLSKNSPITLAAQATNPDGTLRDVNLRIPSHRNLEWSQNKHASLSGMDESGAPNELKNEGMNENISEYSNLAVRILQQKKDTGKVNPVDATRFIEMSDKLAHSEGILRKAQQMYLPSSAGGPVFGDNAIGRNVVALGDRKIAQMFRINEDDPNYGLKLTQAKSLLTTGNEAAYYTLYPHLSQNKMLRLQALPMDSIKGMSVGNMPDAIGVHPRTQSQLDKDTDVDAALVALSSRYEWDETNGKYRVAEAGQGPMSVADLNKRNAALMLTGQGEAEWRKWFDPKDGDMSKYDTPEKLKAYLSNLMPERMAMISGQGIQLSGYIEETKYKWRMGEFYNMARKSMAISGFNEMSARMWEPYYQAALDKTPLTERQEAGYQMLRSLQPATKGFKSGETDEGDALLGRFKSKDEALSNIMLKLWTGEGGVLDPDSIQPGMIEELFPNVDPTRMASFRKIMGANLKNGPAMAGALLFGSMPWTNAGSIGGPALALKSMILRRHKQKNVAGFLLGESLSPEDEIIKDMGDSAESLKDVMSARFDTTDEAVEALQNSLVQTEPGKRGGIAFGSYFSGVYQRLGLVDSNGNPKFRPLEGFSRKAGFEIPGNPPEHTNPALGPGVYLTARIQPEESRLLRGLEAIGRTDPDKARQISDWLGAQAQAGNVAGLHIYQNTSIQPGVGGGIPGGPTYSPDQQKSLELMHDSIKLAINSQSLLAAERHQTALNMPAQQADVVMQAIANVAQGQSFNPAKFLKVSGLSSDNEIFDSLMRVHQGMSSGVNQGSIGTFTRAAVNLADFSNHQQTRFRNQEFFHQLGASSGRFGANATTAYEDLAAMLDVTDGATSAQMKTGLSYNGSMSYSFGGAASRNTSGDLRPTTLGDEAWRNLGNTMNQLEPIVTKLATAHGEMAKSLAEQAKPLEKARDLLLGAIGTAGTMEAKAEAMSGGDPTRKNNAMRALMSGGVMDIETAQMLNMGMAGGGGGGGGRIGSTGGVGGGALGDDGGILDGIMGGKGALSKFLKGGQVMNGLQLFALDRIDKMFTNQAIGSTLAGAQTEAGYNAMLERSGYAVNPSIAMQSAGSYGALQNAWQRQDSATWSTIVGGASNILSGAGGGAATILGAAGAGAALGGFVGFTIGGGPIGAMVGAGIGGIGSGVAAAWSRQQYLKDNTAFAASDAYSQFAGANGDAITTGANGQASINWNPASVDADGFKLGSIQNPGTQFDSYSPAQRASIMAGLRYKNIAAAGAPRALMQGLSAQEKLEVANNVFNPLLKQGWSSAAINQAFQQNQNYFGGGNQNMPALLESTMSGVNIDQAASMMAGLDGGSFASYGGQALSYSGNYVGFQNSLMGMSSQFSGFMSATGNGLTMMGNESFQGLGKRTQNILTAIAGASAGTLSGSDDRGLKSPANIDQIARLLKWGGSKGTDLARQMATSNQQAYAPADSAYDALVSMGVSQNQARDVANSLIGASPQSVGAAGGLVGQMMGLGMSSSDAGSVMVQAASMGTGASRVFGNVLAGSPYAMSLYGQLSGDNRMITRETGMGPNGGTRGLPLFTTTLGYGNMSAATSMHNIFGAQLQPGGLVGPGVQNAMLNGGPNLTGQSYGGLWGAQDLLQQQGWNIQLGGIGIAAGNVQRDLAFATGTGLSAYTNIFTGQKFQEGQGTWALEDQSIALQRTQQRAQIGWQLQGIGLQTSQFNETQAFNKGFRNEQRQWQLEDFAIQGQTMGLQREWQSQDWSFNKNIMARDYGWQQEDFNTNIRRSQGFERHQLEKEKSRSTQAYDTSLTHENTVESRQKQMWHIEDVQFSNQKKRAQEVYDIDMKRFDLEKKQFTERMAMDASHAAQQLAWIDEQSKLEDAQRELQRTQYKLGKESEMASLGNQAAGIANEKTRYATEQGLSREMQKHQSALQSRIDTEVGFYNAIGDWFERMKAYLDGGASGSHPVLLAPGPVHGPGSHGGGTDGGSAVGYQGLPRDTVVGEFGPEIVRNNGRWMSVSPTLPSFDTSFHGGTSAPQAGDVYVILDGDVIAAKMVTRSAKKLNRDRKR